MGVLFRLRWSSIACLIRYLHGPSLQLAVVGFRPISWMPLVIVAVGALILYSYVSASPLPWNGYGHSVFDFGGVVSMPGGQYVSFTLGDNQLLPRGSFVLATAGVIPNQSSPDAPAGVYFRLTFAGATVADGYGVFSHSFETSEDAQGSDRPQFIFQNDNPFRVEVDVRAFVVVAPTPWEHYLFYLPVLVLAGGLAAFWLVYSAYLRKPSRHV